jgi:DNA mismatch endonuclease, patch repair protein
MRANRSRDTGPEKALRSACHALGLRFRVDVAPIPGSHRRADMVFSRRQIAVFVDGCWWHGCPEHWRRPKSNPEYWLDKVRHNQARDRDTDRRLIAAGWRVVRVWEHDDPIEVAERIRELVRTPSPRGAEEA